MTSPIWGQYDDAPTVTISGKVRNFDPKNLEILFVFSRAGFFQESAIRTNMDKNGNFKASFKTYIPTEFEVCYKLAPIFTASVYPKDNIYIKSFSSYKENMTNPIGVVFKGSSAKFNSEIFFFKRLCFNSNINPYKPLPVQWVPLDRFTPVAYAKYLKDTVLVKCDDLLKCYVQKYKPSVEALEWCKFYYEVNEYYEQLAHYPGDYFSSEGYYNVKERVENYIKKKDIPVPEIYYNPLTSSLPLKNSMFLNSIALADYIRTFYNYIIKKTVCEQNSEYCNKYEWRGLKTNCNFDSLKIAGIRKYIKDPLLKQMLLANTLVDGMYCKEKLMSFKKYESSIVKQQIKEPYLKSHLYYMYEKAKKVVEEREKEKK
ncbi:MAG: hypothetical protein JZU53_06495 [Paludibacter sp.]|nr:hypothetical protein [Paludibacter sp.]